MDGDNFFLGMNDEEPFTRDKTTMRMTAPRAEAVSLVKPRVEQLAREVVSRAKNRIDIVMELTFDPDDKGAFNFEPPAFHLHRWTAAGGIVTHTAYVEDFPGPYPFVAAPEYPGKAA